MLNQLALLMALFAQGDTNSLPEKTFLPDEGVEMTFTLGRKRPLPMVEAWINGKGPYSFVFDTGASIMVVYESFATEQAFDDLGETRFGDPSRSGRTKARKVRIDSVTLGEARFETLEAATLKRSRMNLGDDVMGILPLTLFTDSLFTLDYRKSRIALRKGALGKPGKKGIIAYKAGGLPEVEIDVAGTKLAAHIDSGAPSSFNLPESVVKGLELKKEPVKVGRGQTVNSYFTIKSTQIKGAIRFAGYTFDDPEIHYNDLFPMANIGYGLLRDFVITFDQKNLRIRFEHMAEPVRDEQPRLGVKAAFDGNSMEVKEIEPGSPAGKAGLKTGDMIIVINGKRIADYEPGSIREAMGSLPLKLRVIRGEKMLEIKVD